MPDSDGALSRLRTKLLRRTSSSGGAKNPPTPSASASSPVSQHHDSNNHNNSNSNDNNPLLHLKGVLESKRDSKQSFLPSPAPSPLATPVNARPLSQTVLPAQPNNTTSAGESEPESKECLEQTPESIQSTHGELALASPSSHPCPQPVSVAVASLPTPPPSAPQIAPPASARKLSRRLSDFDAESPPSQSDPAVVAEAQRTSLPHRNYEDYGFSPLSRENSTYLPRLSRQSTRSVAAASTRSLNVVDEKAPDRFTPPLSQPPSRALPSPNPSARPSIAVRRQSLVPASQQSLIKSLLDPSHPPTGGEYFSRSTGTPSIQADMIHRKIWVKRAGCSPTLVVVTEDDLVDDLRDAILKKYGNSLGHTFDAPDILLKLVPREPSSRQSHQERTLGPEEPVGRTLDTYFPDGQTVDEALVIELSQRRTPRPSPRHAASYRHPDDVRPAGEAGDYFSPMGMVQTPNAAPSVSSSSGPSSHHGQPQSMLVVKTGQLPPVPSPGSRGSWHQHQQHRPKYPRQHTSSPTMVPALPSAGINDSTNAPTNGAAPIPSPPAANSSVTPLPDPATKAVGTPPARTSSPRLVQKQMKKLKMSSSNSTTGGALPAGLLDGTVPPINVLIVEDNIINLKLLEAFMKRLKVRWQTATNGREAVNKWRQGGFHLVLMDIQLPVMNGLEATREIRRLERLNGIGAFSKAVFGPTNGEVDLTEESSGDQQPDEELMATDKLDKQSQFKSPVIIVALTASSLQSDRHEALAAGCNDFLTKPVNIMWLEQKVTEWGCMQALIDFEGWRKWRGFADAPPKSPSQPQTALISDAQNTDPPQTGTRRPPLPTRAGESFNAKDGSQSRRGSHANVVYSSAGNAKSSSANSSSTVVPHASSPGGTGKNTSWGSANFATVKKGSRGGSATPSSKTTPTTTTAT